MDRRGWSGWCVMVWLVAGVVAMLWLGCSDTTCRDKIGPDGQLVTSDQCTFNPDADAEENSPTSNGTGNGGGGGTANNGGSGDGGMATSGPGDSSEPVGDGGGGEDTGAVGEDSEAMPDLPEPMQTIVGAWISSGQDLSPLLRGGGAAIARIEVSFGRQGGYEGLIVLETGDEFAFRGTYEVDDRTEPGGIVLRQSEPQALTSQGIYAIEADGQGSVLMRYEVVQIEPPTPGFQPPTPQRGFGSTVGVEDPEDNVQIYRLAP
ncbi:MAG: hypothetical protein AAFX99_36190 [Myxococcota bacterium]